jgi:hypothetical protein
MPFLKREEARKEIYRKQRSFPSLNDMPEARIVVDP